jgi:hypothetical protein
MSTPIARYYASLGIMVDKKSVALVDTTLNRLEQKIRNFGKLTSKNLKITFDIARFNVDQNRLNLALGNALDIASMRNTFQVSRFNVDQQALNRSVANAAQIASRQARVRVRATATGDGGGITSRHAVAAGGVGGLAARAYMPALALAGGGYGAGWLNRRNQDVVSAQLMTQAVVQQAGGTTEQGVQSFDWLRGQGERVGFNYLDAAPDFNKLISGLTGAGMSVDTSQETFKGFAELSRVNKLDKTSQNRLFRALSQVAGKNQLMSEELTGQIAEALPGGVALFAEAYQRQTGGNLKGTESISALREAMKDRAVKGDILPIAAQIASEKASGGLSAASKASQAEQSRAQNALNDRAITASNAGVEQGFARLFKTFAITLQESGPLVEKMAQGFNSMSLYASNALLSIQSITRFFQGRDSLLGDKLFPDEASKNAAFVWLESLKNAMGEMEKLGGNIYTGWEKLLALFDTSTGLEKATNFLNLVANTSGVLNNLIDGDYKAASASAQGVGGSGLKTALGMNPVSMSLDLATGGRFSEYALKPFRNLENPAEFESTYKAEQARMRTAGFNQYALPGVNQPLNGMQSTNLEIKMDVSITAANPEDFNSQFQDKFKSVIESTMMQYSQKE